MKTVIITRSRHGKLKGSDCDEDVWKEIFSQYPTKVRHDAANLAAHSWDVTLIGERILVSCAWSGGHYWDKDGNREELSFEEVVEFYPPAEDQENARYAPAGAYTEYVHYPDGPCPQPPIRQSIYLSKTMSVEHLA